MSTKQSPLSSKKIFRVLRFIFQYFPELCRIHFQNFFTRITDRRCVIEDVGELQCVRAYFGPLYILRDDPGIRAVKKKGYYDLTMTVALERYLKPGMTVINVGANIGYFAALSALRTNNTVLCVEPHPRCLRALEKNKRLYPKLQIFPYVASDHSGMESFILDNEATGNSSIAPSAVGSTIQIEARTLDAITSASRVDIMIIDAQGAEPKILRGSERLLSQLSLIFFEFWPYGLELAGFQADELLSQFHSHGFTLSHFFPSFHPDPEQDPTGLIVSLKQQDRGMGFCNLLASK